MAEAAALLRALSEQVSAVASHGRETLRRVRSGRFSTQKGLSVLELRAQGLLGYLGDLALLIGRKVAGKAVGGATERDRLVETRVVLDKLRPLERRLRYHIEKLLRAAAAGGRDANDPLSFRPRPSAMTSQEEEEEEAEPAAPKAPGLGGGKRYVPPRLVPVTYDSMGQPPKRRLRGALSSALIRDLRAELGEGPEEQPGGGARPCPAHAHRTRLEESLLLRLGRGRKGRGQRGRSLDEGRDLHTITHFGDVSALLDPTNQEAPPPKRKKLKKPKKGRGFRRRRR